MSRIHDSTIRLANECIRDINKKEISNELIKRTFDNKEEIMNKIKINFLGKGVGGSVYSINIQNCVNIAIKISKVNKKSQNEIIIFELIKQIIIDNICPNFLFYYGSYKFNNYQFIFTELATNTLEQWTIEKHNSIEWKSILKQLLLGILTIQKVLCGYHSDLKPKNILFKKVPYDYIANYYIDKKTYNVNTFGTLILIADFDIFKTTLLDQNINNRKMSDKDVLLNIQNNSDLEHIIIFHKRILSNILIKLYNYDDLINIISRYNDNNYEKYVLDIKKDLINRHYKGKDFDHRLLQNLTYYIIEHKYVKYDEIQQKYNNLFLPPNDIIYILENCLPIDGSKTIEEMLEIIE
jgi:hypothetical protein